MANVTLIPKKHRTLMTIPERITEWRHKWKDQALNFGIPQADEIITALVSENRRLQNENDKLRKGSESKVSGLRLGTDIAQQYSREAR